MNNMQIRYSTDGAGNRSTNATYQDDTGAYRSAREPGTLSAEQMKMRIQMYRQQDRNGLYHAARKR